MRRKGSNVTISDIAKKVNVSKTTISRYLNKQFEYMSLETKERIEKVIEEMNYIPNSMARSLRSKKSKLIGVIIHSLDNQSVSILVRGISDACYKNGYSTIIYNSHSDIAREKEYLDKCIEQQVDGIILSAANIDFDYYHKIYEQNIPIVMVNRYNDNWKYDAVYIDHYSLVTEALMYIKNNGYDKIAFFSDKQNEISTKTLRENAFIDFNNKFQNTEINEVFFHLPMNNKENKSIRNNLIKTIKTFIEKYPNDSKALVACDVEMLYHIVSCLKEMNIEIPDQLGLCGYDVWDWASLMTPSISTMKQPFYKTGVAASNLIAKRIKDNTASKIEKIVLKGTFYPRDSTSKVANH